jgi:hypothetical protein
MKITRLGGTFEAKFLILEVKFVVLWPKHDCPIYIINYLASRMLF